MRRPACAGAGAARALIVLVLMLVVVGAAAGSVTLWVQGAPWWQIALGYVGGGWIGLIAGVPAILAGRWLFQRLPRRPAADDVHRPGRAEAAARCRQHR